MLATVDVAADLSFNQKSIQTQLNQGRLPNRRDNKHFLEPVPEGNLIYNTGPLMKLVE